MNGCAQIEADSTNGREAWDDVTNVNFSFHRAAISVNSSTEVLNMHLMFKRIIMQL